MTDLVKEQLSACLDGELPEGELDLLLRQVSRDPQLRASLGRYALIGEALRSPGTIAAPAHFAERISQAIAAEAAAHEVNVPSPETSRKNGIRATQWLRPASGFAVAAGVAALAILGLQQPEQTAESPLVAGTAAPTPVSVDPAPGDAGSYIVPANTSASGYVPAARLTNYVVAHSEYSTPLGRRSVLSGVLTEESESADDAAIDSLSPTDEDAARP